MMEEENIQTKEIGDSKFLAFKLPAKKAWHLQLRLMKILGPSLQSLASLTSEKDKAKQDSEALEVLSQFMGNIDPDELTNLIVEVSSYARKDGEQINASNFDEMFADNFNQAFLVAMFVIEVNFKDFFKGVNQSALGQKIQSMTQA